MMFQSLNLDQSVDRKTFREQSTSLRSALLETQFALQENGRRVLLIITGVPGAGRGGLVHRLNEWFDARGVTTTAFWDHSDEEEERPYRWRFWRSLPSRGRIGIFFGSWYSRSLRARTRGQMEDDAYDAELHRIVDLERMLHEDGLIIIKLWLHISKERQLEQLEQRLDPDQLNRILPQDRGSITERYEALLNASERMITQTDRPGANWQIVEAHDAYHRDLSAGQYILRQMRAALTTMSVQSDKTLPEKAKINAKFRESPDISGIPASLLDNVDLSSALSSEEYAPRLEALQARLTQLTWAARSAKQSLVIVFEGWDAAGKGSAIRRVTQSIDPRLFSLAQISAPTEEERCQHYLWRFWRQLARDGRTMIFDRSWYGRVLVERIEGLASETEWQRSFAEINHFEDEMRRHNWAILKFFMHISPQEQWARFEERRNTPHKQHKITEDDWRNRARWPAYTVAIDEMIRRTSTEHAPWTLVPANDKRFARIMVLQTICERLEAALAQHAEATQPAPGSVRVLT